MKVKICGITDVETALYVAGHGADAIGFVFADSNRRISIERATEIIKQLPPDILKVGVFVNESVETIEEIVAATGINTIQLHGDETPEFCAQFSVPVIKALSISREEDLANIKDYSCEYILLDSPKGKYRGGNGVTFDWKVLADAHFVGKKIILAGGLSVDNLATGIELVRPFMVDVSSGVEINGKKEPNKIKKFIKKAKSLTKEEIK